MWIDKRDTQFSTLTVISLLNKRDSKIYLSIESKEFTKENTILDTYIFNYYSCLFEDIMLSNMTDIKQWRKN